MFHDLDLKRGAFVWLMLVPLVSPSQLPCQVPLLLSWCSSPLMHLGRQQEMPQMLGPLTPMWERPKWSFWLLALAWLLFCFGLVFCYGLAVVTAIWKVNQQIEVCSLSLSLCACLSLLHSIFQKNKPLPKKKKKRQIWLLSYQINQMNVLSCLSSLMR